MFKIFYAKSDATLYEDATVNETNTGLDEILEIGKRINLSDDSLLVNSRALVKFDSTEISQSLATYGKTVNDCKFVLNLYTSHAKNLPTEYTIDACIAGQPWTNGTGFLSSVPEVSNGVQWAQPMSSWSLNSQTGNLWISSSQQIHVNNSFLYVSGSGLGGSFLYYSGSGTPLNLIASESFSYRTADVNVNVTTALKVWLSGSNGNAVPNNGFLLKFSDADELNSYVSGYVRFFSRETHTIYVPKLTMYWDDVVYSSQLNAVDLDSYTTYVKIKPEYKDNEITKLRIYGRDRFPKKSPTNLFPIQTVKRLPATTYYAILDAVTDEYIIPYDDIYTKVSCDNTSNYIYVDMSGFMPERYYRLQLKLTDGFTTQYIDCDTYFKIVR